jgi:hypothetical protein
MAHWHWSGAQSQENSNKSGVLLFHLDIRVEKQIVQIKEPLGMKNLLHQSGQSY